MIHQRIGEGFARCRPGTATRLTGETHDDFATLGCHHTQASPNIRHYVSAYQSRKIGIGWEASTAKAILSAIEGAASRALPGYDDAPWEIKAKQGVAPYADS